MKRSLFAITAMVIITLLLGAAFSVSADRLSSPSFTIDTSVAAPFGGQSSSTNYKMVSSGAESINGTSVSGSYKLGQGYVAQLTQSIELTLSQTTVALGTITPNVSSVGSLGATVATDGPGYSLSINQNSNLTSGPNTIPPISPGTIASPVAWTEGTTKGLGFTLTDGPSLPAKWGTLGNYRYSAIPNTPTALYTRTGYTGGVSETISLQPRIDIIPTQATGGYSNVVTITATLIP